MATDVRGGTSRAVGPRGLDRVSTETKHAFKTTEFWAMLAVVAGILLASLIVGDDGGRLEKAQEVAAATMAGAQATQAAAGAGLAAAVIAGASGFVAGMTIALLLVVARD